jgi:ATP synthase protein I
MGDDRSPKTTRDKTDGDRKRLDALDDRLREARKGSEPPARSSTQREMGVAYRVMVEMIVGVGVGGFLGWWLDSWLGTAPLLMLALIFLGFAAGAMNAYRAIRQYTAAANRDGNGP